MHELKLKRIYEPESPDDGTRILVDRLWPRGISKVRADLAEWDKTVAPDTALRKSFHDKEESWQQFEKDYVSELDANPEAQKLADEVSNLLQTGNVTLLYGSKDEAHNNAVVLKSWIEAHMKK